MPEPPKKPAPPPTPRGDAIDWSDEDLAAFTTPEALMGSQDEIAQAWRRDAPADARAMIDAPADDAPAPPPDEPNA